MPRRADGYRELTDPRNKEILGTFTPRALLGVSVEVVAAEFYRMDPEACTNDDVGRRPYDCRGGCDACRAFIEAGLGLERRLMDEYTSRSGTLGGAHREDLTRAVMGAAPSTWFGGGAGGSGDGATGESGQGAAPATGGGQGRRGL